MAITDLKLKDSDIAAKGVAAAPTVLNGTPEENKRVFDRLVREVLKGDFNGLIDALTAATGAGEIGASVEGLTGATVQAILNAIKAALDAKASDATTSAALEGKADKLTISSHIKEVELDSSTGVFTFTRQNGTKITIDTALEKVAVNFAYDKASQSLKLTLADGSTETVPLSDFITVTEFEDSDTLEWSVSADGSKAKATIKAGSITDTMLSSALKGLLAGYVNKAAQAATAAAGSESSALSYKNVAEAAAQDAAGSKKTVGDYATAAQQAADDAKSNAAAARQSANTAGAASANAEEMESRSADNAENAEAWAVGQRKGVDVGAEDPAYQKSAKYWAEQAAGGGTGGTPGADGKSAYEIAVEEGFEGDKDAWLASLKGDDGAPGIVISSEEPTDPSHPVWIDPEGDETPDNPLGITGAAVGQIAKITAVDGTGLPIAWEPVDITAGDTWELINTFEVAEADAARVIKIDKDSNGNTFSLKEFAFSAKTNSTKTDGNVYGWFCVNGKGTYNSGLGGFQTNFVRHPSSGAAIVNDVIGRALPFGLVYDQSTGRKAVEGIQNSTVTDVHEVEFAGYQYAENLLYGTFSLWGVRK